MDKANTLLKTKAMDVLVKNLGVVETERFITLVLFAYSFIPTLFQKPTQVKNNMAVFINAAPYRVIPFKPPVVNRVKAIGF